MNTTEEQRRRALLEICNRVIPLGWMPAGNFRFRSPKFGSIHDLSAADLDQLDRIERAGLFLVGNLDLEEPA